jgi:hypothetical protein
MRALTNHEVVAWVASQPDLVVDERELRFPPSDVEPLHFHFPMKEGQLLYFARLLASLHHDETTFAGALLWITQTGVWGKFVEDIGHRTMRLLRAGGSQNVLRENPAQLFGEHELLDAVIFLLQPILVGWDAYYYPIFKDARSDFLVKISHDAYADVMPVDPAARRAIQERLAGTAFGEADCRCL